MNTVQTWQNNNVYLWHRYSLTNQITGPLYDLLIIITAASPSRTVSDLGTLPRLLTFWLCFWLASLILCLGAISACSLQSDSRAARSSVGERKFISISYVTLTPQLFSTPQVNCHGQYFKNIQAYRCKTRLETKAWTKQSSRAEQRVNVWSIINPLGAAFSLSVDFPQSISKLRPGYGCRRQQVRVPCTAF